VLKGITSQKHDIISTLTLNQLLILSSALVQERKKKENFIKTYEVLECYKLLCKTHKLSPISDKDFLNVCDLLISNKLISFYTEKKSRKIMFDTLQFQSTIILNVEVEFLKYALESRDNGYYSRFLTGII